MEGSLVVVRLKVGLLDLRLVQNDDREAMRDWEGNGCACFWYGAV